MIGSRISSGSSFEQLAGYSRAVVVPDPGGDWVFVSGTTGFDYQTMTISEDVEQQARQCFANISKALGMAGCSLKNAVRTVVYLSAASDFAKIAPILGEYLRPASPASTAVVAQLIDPRMKIEIEITARCERSA